MASPIVVVMAGLVPAIPVFGSCGHPDQAVHAEPGDDQSHESHQDALRNHAAQPTGEGCSEDALAAPSTMRFMMRQVRVEVYARSSLGRADDWRHRFCDAVYPRGFCLRARPGETFSAVGVSGSFGVILVGIKSGCSETPTGIDKTTF